MLWTPLAVPVFDVDLGHGLDFTLQNSPTPQKYLIETMPGGVALLDYNNDGLLDIFLVNGGRITSPMQTPENFDRQNPRYWNRLYRQNKDGSFTDVTQQAGLANAGDSNYGMGVAVGDYDNDGYADLFVTNYGKNILYHNNGDGTFTDVTAKAGVAGGGWSVSAGFFDYDNDGKLDLFVTRYMDWDTKHSKDCGGNYHTYCPPEEFPATSSILYHNNGDGTFTDVSQRSGIAAKKGRALGVAFADYDEDGYTDIFVANDGMQQYLFHNNGNGTFTELGLEAGAALSEDGRRLSGMGVVFQDYDNDGRPDVIVTELPREIYGVYHNDDGGSFSYRSLETGLGVLSSGSSRMGRGLGGLRQRWLERPVRRSGPRIGQCGAHRPVPALSGTSATSDESQWPLRTRRFRKHDSGRRARSCVRRFKQRRLGGCGDDLSRRPPSGIPQSRGQGALAGDFAARYPQQPRRIRRPGQSKRTNAVCNLRWKLRFVERQAPSFWTRNCRKSQGGNRVAIRHSPDCRGCSC